jgi:hypothetical protein
MALTDINSAERVGLEEREEFIPAPRSTLTSRQCTSQNFNNYLGYYDEIPELQAVIDKLAL